MATRGKSPDTPLIVHLVYRFATGGLENGLINLVNSLSTTLARHHIIALVGVDYDFAARIMNPACEIENLGASPAQQTLRQLPAIYRRLRTLKPDIVHTRNISTLECQYAAWAARVPGRVHGEHGWDEFDQYGRNRRYTRLRQITRRFVHRQVALSRQTGEYLENTIGVSPQMLREIHNGVDTERFRPNRPSATEPLPNGWPFADNDFIVGSVGRLSSVKNQMLMCKAFCELRRNSVEFRRRAKLVVVGDGPDAALLQLHMENEGASDSAWFAGDRRDIPQLLRQLDVFCLPSKAEGLSNSVLEAMATALPIVVTNVGGNSEQIEDGISGTLTPSEDVHAMASALHQYFESSNLRRQHSQAARERVVSSFSLQAMVANYHQLYAELLSTTARHD